MVYDLKKNKMEDDNNNKNEEDLNKKIVYDLKENKMEEDNNEDDPHPSKKEDTLKKQNKQK
jgi:hypothetical protein